MQDEEKKEEEQEEGHEETGDTKDVDVTELTDEELASRLKGEEEDSEDKSTDTDADAGSQEDEDEAKEKPGKPEDEGKGQEEEAGKKAEGAQPGKKPEEDTVKDAEIQKLRAQIQENQKYIDRQGTEIGELRKKVTQPPPATEEEKEQKNAGFFDDPGKAVKETVNETLDEREEKDAKAKADAMEFRAGNERAVLEQIPEFNELVGDIAELAKADGFSEEHLVMFKRDPFLTSEPAILINYARTAKAKREIATLTSKVGDLQTQIKSRGEDVIKKIEAASKAGKPLTGKTPGTPRSEPGHIPDEAIPNLSDAELAEALKNQPLNS